ncbi:fibrous sheath CABYR-binding protein-like [Eptesicus fuscus]|uniref:fibrous sheath CABYR-binding protein-like n=1 Tax=Eptesicus fuscus TaxID=29078 RepID=UPI002404360A|nr:fibrous sheath CABYR-binding protein-like [Eptesicus fuscus]
MTSSGSGKPWPFSARRWSPPQKPIRFRRPPSLKLLNQQRRIALHNSFLESPRFRKRFPMCDAFLEHQAHVNHTGPEDLQPQGAEPKAPAQEAEEAPAETPEVQTEASDKESDEELEAWAPPELLPPPSASPVAAVEPGPALEAPADMTEAPPPLDEEPSLEPALGLPVSPGQGLKRGSDESRFRIGRRWFRTQHRPLSPLTRLEPEVTQGGPGWLCAGQATTLTHLSSPMSPPCVKAGWVDVECGWPPLPEVYPEPWR